MGVVSARSIIIYVQDARLLPESGGWSAGSRSGISVFAHKCSVLSVLSSNRRGVAAGS